MGAKKRKNTKLEAEGAEFLAVGWLLIHGIEAHKAYTNMPGYDLIATNADNHTAARIQVKSRYETGVAHILIGNFDSDFVVIALLNRGYKKARKNGDTGVREPELYVVPTAVMEAAHNPDDGWNKVKLKNIPNLDNYKDQWSLVKTFLDCSD